MTKRLIDSHSQYHASPNHAFVPLPHQSSFNPVFHLDDLFLSSSVQVFQSNVFSFLKGFPNPRSSLLSELATRTVVFSSFNSNLATSCVQVPYNMENISHVSSLISIPLQGSLHFNSCASGSMGRVSILKLFLKQIFAQDVSCFDTRDFLLRCTLFRCSRLFVKTKN